VRKVITDIFKEEDWITRFDHNNPNALYDVVISNEILGPSFMINIGKKHEIAFTTAARTYGNIKDVTGHVGENAFAYLLEQDLWKTTFHDETVSLDAMQWLEYGAHYATILYHENKNELKGGISLKFLQGVFGAYMNNTNLTYNIVDTSQLI